MTGTALWRLKLLFDDLNWGLKEYDVIAAYFVLPDQVEATTLEDFIYQPWDASSQPKFAQKGSKIPKFRIHHGFVPSIARRSCRRNQGQ